MYWCKLILASQIAAFTILGGGHAVKAEVGSSLLTQAESDTKEEHFAVANVSTKLNIRSDPDSSGQIVGKIPTDGLMKIEDYRNGWCLITSGDVTGYVSADYLYSPADSAKIIQKVGISNLPAAFKVSPVRQQLISFGSQFIGNPYVWGGTSLTDGADCSGYVQRVYSNFGISLPRVSAEQSKVGKQIPVDEAQPADLIFYAKQGSVYHVVINLGDGQVLNASNKKKGICVSSLDSAHAVWAVDVIG